MSHRPKSRRISTLVFVPQDAHTVDIFPFLQLLTSENLFVWLNKQMWSKNGPLALFQSQF